jgi:hypothetical protein
LIDHAGVVTPPTAFSSDERNFAEIALPALPYTLRDVSHLPGSRGIVPNVYFGAIHRIEEQPTLYENFAKFGQLHSAELKQVDVELPTTFDLGDGKIFLHNETTIVSYKHAKPAIDALQLLGKIKIDRIGLLNAHADRPEQAKEAYLAGFVLGVHLCTERLTYDEYQLGQELLSKASAALASLAEQTNKVDEAAEWRAFDARRVAENKLHIDPVLKLVRSIDANTVGPHAGDLFELAKRSRERMWRVEAILAIGRMRYFAGAGGTAANQRAANALLRDLADHDPDPIIRTAAETARDLTIEEYRMQ